MRQRWDAEQQRWIDDDAGAVGAQLPTGQAGQAGQQGQAGPPRHGEERPWWAGAETQIGTVRPPSVPDAPATPAYAAPPTYAAPPPPPPPPAAPSYPRQPEYVPATFPGTASVPAPGPHPRSPRTTLVLVAVLAVLVGSGAAAGVWWLTRDDSARQAQARPSAAGSATGNRSVAPPADTGDGPPSPSDTERALAHSAGPSPGYRRAEDPVGYRVDVPEGWVREEERGVSAEVVTYRSPADGRSLLIFEVVEESPAASLDLAENGPGGFTGKLAGYRVLDRSSGPDWAELDYRYDDTSSGATRVVDRRFTAADGTLYAIRSSGPEGSDVREPFDAAFTSFCPTGASCPAT